MKKHILTSILACTLLSSCTSTNSHNFPNCYLEPRLEKAIGSEIFQERARQTGNTSEWSSNFILFSSRPVYNIAIRDISIQPTSPGQNSGVNYDPGQIKKDETLTRMAVKGLIIVERKRENALLDFGLFRLIPWNGKAEYLDVPLNFTYFSTFTEQNTSPTQKATHGQ